MEITTNLINEIKGGNLILFLGAGAAFDSYHPNGIQPPSGGDLSKMIAKKFLDASYHDNSNLQYVSELAISQTDLITVQKFVADIFKEFKAGAAHLRIPQYRWRSLYTTNYDQIIEDAYNSASHNCQKLATFIKNGERIRDKVVSTDSIVYNKLHGCITEISDPKLPLILTPDQYIE